MTLHHFKHFKAEKGRFKHRLFRRLFLRNREKCEKRSLRKSRLSPDETLSGKEFRMECSRHAGGPENYRSAQQVNTANPIAISTFALYEGRPTLPDRAHPLKLCGTAEAQSSTRLRLKRALKAFSDAYAHARPHAY
jgi:hypothetical protein